MNGNDRDWIVLKLADFVLIKLRYKLVMTTRKKEDLEKVMEHYRQTYPKRRFFMRQYAVRVISKKKKKVQAWEKVKGFSLWEKI